MRYFLLVLVFLSGCTAQVYHQDDYDAGQMQFGDAGPGDTGAIQTADTGLPGDDAAVPGDDAATDVDTGTDSGAPCVGVECPDDAGTPPDAGTHDAGPGHDAAPTTDAGTPPDLTAPNAVVGGEQHTCLLRDSGRVFCWGNPAMTSPISDADTIAADGQSTCFLRGAGELWCMDGRVPGVSSLATISTHCGISSTGAVQCWGGVSAPTPTATAIDQFTFADVPYTQTCAVRPDASVACSTTLGSSITMPPPDLRVAQVTAGGLICARSDTGHVYCWDVARSLWASYDLSGGPGGLAVYTDVASGRAHACGIHSDHTVWCWGDNHFDQLGRSTLSGSTDPHRSNEAREVLMGGAHLDAVDLDTGRDHTCAILRDGRVVCWGSNSGGQLGTWVPGLMTIEPVEPDSYWLR